MSITRRAHGDRVIVTFELPDTVTADHIVVVADFNEWSTSATPMTREPGGWSATVELRPGRVYRFRYLLDGERWANDWNADSYAPNAFGGDDSVLDLTRSASGGSG